MRLLFLAPQPFFQHRGTPIAARAVLEVLGTRGYEVDVLTYHEGEDIDLPNCTIHRIPAPGRIANIRPGFSRSKVICDAVMLREATRMIRRKRYDLLHAIEEAAFIAALIKRRYGIPFIYDMDSSLAQQMVERFGWLRPVRRLLDQAEALAVRESLGILAVCRAVEEVALLHDPGHLVARVEDPSLLDGGTEGVEDLRQTIGRSGPIIMYVGNLERYQGVDLLLDSFARALGGVPNAQLVVLGGATADIARYRRRAHSLGIEANAHFLGPRPVTQLGYYLRQADVLVSPRSQGFNTPMKIYSYLDSGRATLATRLPTHTQVLDDQIALLADPTPEAFGAALGLLLEDGPLRERLAAAARLRVRREFTPAAFRRKVAAFYDRVEERLAAAPARSLVCVEGDAGAG